MAKRLTDSGKWDDPWFLDLTSDHKLLWLYILDRCDHAGIWKVNRRLAEFCLGGQIDWQSFEASCNGRLIKLSDEKWFFPKFIDFQYGNLSELNRAHVSVLNLLKKEGAYKHLTRCLQADKDKDKEKENKGGVGGFKKIPPDIVDLKAEFVKRGYAPSNATDFYDHHNAAGWILKNGKLMRDWGSAIGTWIRMGKKFGTLEKLPPPKQASTSAPVIVEGPQISDEDRRKLIEGALPGYSRKRLIQKT